MLILKKPASSRILIIILTVTASFISFVLTSPNLIGMNNQRESSLAQSTNPKRFPFSDVKSNTIKVSQEDIDMAIMKCIEMDKNFNYVDSLAASIKMTPASKHVFQAICDRPPLSEMR